MANIVSFADGFTSASSPTVVGGVQEDYTISNNTTGGAVATLSSSSTKAVFADYELRRVTSLGTFQQTGGVIFSYDTSWSLSFGNYMGDEMFVDTIASTEHVKLMINSSTGAITYDSGNMSGTGYVGTLKLNISRMV
jgi:hypothetical protein